MSVYTWTLYLSAGWLSFVYTVVSGIPSIYCLERKKEKTEETKCFLSRHFKEMKLAKYKMLIRSGNQAKAWRHLECHGDGGELYRSPLKHWDQDAFAIDTPRLTGVFFDRLAETGGFCSLQCAFNFSDVHGTSFDSNRVSRKPQYQAVLGASRRGIFIGPRTFD